MANPELKYDSINYLPRTPISLCFDCIYCNEALDGLAYIYDERDGPLFPESGSCERCRMRKIFWGLEVTPSEGLFDENGSVHYTGDSTTNFTRYGGKYDIQTSDEAPIEGFKVVGISASALSAEVDAISFVFIKHAGLSTDSDIVFNLDGGTNFPHRLSQDETFCSRIDDVTITANLPKAKVVTGGAGTVRVEYLYGKKYIP